MNEAFSFRRADRPEDLDALIPLYAEVFPDEDVAGLAQVLFTHFPDMETRHWLLAEEKQTGELASACALIPWAWEMEGTPLKMAEMGLVGTREKYRNMGLMRMLSRFFDEILDQDGFDLAGIQGIPGFYDKLGYYYGLAMENHIHLPFDMVNSSACANGWEIREATPRDIPFLLESQVLYSERYSVSAKRETRHWEYLLSEGRKTGYGSDFFVAEKTDEKTLYFIRIQRQGFGDGLIISEISESAPDRVLECLYSHAKKLAQERGKPYIRVNMHNDAGPVQFLIQKGVKKSPSYAWQVKIPDKARFLRTITGVLEKRLHESRFSGFSGVFRMDFFTGHLDLVFANGSLVSLETREENQPTHVFHIHESLFPALCLGHRAWREIQYIRPDIFPEFQFVHPDENTLVTGRLADTLFPKKNSWIYLQY